MADLGEFDGRDVRKTTVAITNAGDGLSRALAVEPRELHLGQRVIVALECEVAKVRFDPITEGSSDLTRVHILRAGAATIIDEETAARIRSVLEDQAQRIQAARDAETGAEALNLEFDPLDVGGPTPEPRKRGRKKKEDE